MGIVKTKGIVISENLVKDYDKMLTILTPDLGKISCSAKGARRTKSPLLAGSSFLCFGEYVFYKGSEIYNMNSCETIEVFYNIRTDLDKLNLVAELTKLISKVTVENQNSFKILQLYLNTLHIISETDKNLDMVKSVFKMRLLSILGFTPYIKNCVNCSEEKVANFSIRDNGFKCSVCGKQDTSCIKIDDATKKAIQYSILADPKKIFSFSITDEAIKEFDIVSKLFLEDKIE